MFTMRTVMTMVRTHPQQLKELCVVKNIDTKQSNKRNNQNSKNKRQDYNMK